MLMGLQLIVKAERKKIEKSLESLTSECEIFPVAEGLFGISIPERILSSVGKMLFYRNLNNSSVLTFGRGPGKNPSDVGFGEFQL